MGFWGIIGAGWRGAFGAIKQNWAMFALIILGYLSITIIFQRSFPTPPPQHAPSLGEIFANMKTTEWRELPWSILSQILTSILYAPAMVTTHRHVLLGENGRVWADFRRLALFAGLVFGLQCLLTELPLVLIFVTPWFALLFLVVIWLGTRLTLAYPAAALDRPRPLKESWQRTSGHWWFVFGVVFVGIMLAMVIFFVVAVIAILFVLIPTTVFSLHHFSAWYAYFAFIFEGIFAIWTVALGAALASELFRKFGSMPAQA